MAGALAELVAAATTDLQALFPPPVSRNAHTLSIISAAKGVFLPARDVLVRLLSQRFASEEEVKEQYVWYPSHRTRRVKLFLKGEYFNKTFSLPVDGGEIAVTVNAVNVPLHKLSVLRLPHKDVEALENAFSKWGEIVAHEHHHKNENALNFYFRSLNNEDLVKVNRLNLDVGELHLRWWKIGNGFCTPYLTNGTLRPKSTRKRTSRGTKKTKNASPPPKGMKNAQENPEQSSSESDPNQMKEVAENSDDEMAEVVAVEDAATSEVELVEDEPSAEISASPTDELLRPDPAGDGRERDESSSLAESEALPQPLILDGCVQLSSGVTLSPEMFDDLSEEVLSGLGLCKRIRRFSPTGSTPPEKKTSSSVDTASEMGTPLRASSLSPEGDGAISPSSHQ